MKVGDWVLVPVKTAIRSTNPNKHEFRSYRDRSVKVAELSGGDVLWVARDGFIYACPATCVRPLPSAGREGSDPSGFRGRRRFHAERSKAA